MLMLLNKIYETGHTRFLSHQTERINTLVKKRDAYYDVLLIGSSRMHVHYNPLIIDSVTHLSSYNFGVEGGNLLETNLWLQVYLQLHRKPKAIVLDMAPFAFDIERRPLFNPTIYYPYLQNDIIYNTVSIYKNISLYKYVPFLELMEVDDYNKSIAIEGLFGKKEVQATHFTYNGFAENGSNVLKADSDIVYNKVLYQITASGKILFNTIIDSCRKKNIKLIISYSPEYYKTDFTKRGDFFDYINQVCINNNLPFIDYRGSSISRDSTLFAEPTHLNKYGAKIFSKDVAGKIMYELNR